jgi:N-acetylgalactosamine-N,N'-diacetylbacillosaminyl-diphospho-undecaprenol 4-alpha-N-acetylgalactosaminyltransferase
MNVYICNDGKNKKNNGFCYEKSQSIMINRNPKYKIALIGDCLAGGGSEKVHALLSQYFQKAGLEVHNCIFVDWISYDYSGSLLNLGIINPESHFIKRKVSRFLQLKNFIKENDFDAVIDFRMRNRFGLEFLLSKYVYPKNTFYTVHSGILEFYFPKSPVLSNLIYKNRKMVAVSKAIQNLILHKQLANNVKQLYNPIDLTAIDVLKNKYAVEDGDFILAVGSMNSEVKQFDKLILAYSKSGLPNKNIKLIIVGEGSNLKKYQQLTEELGVNDSVIFKGFIENPFPYYKAALFTVLSSKNEGFPNVIIESLAAETPVISFDCFSGPNEIIIDKHNGILVENQNIEKLTEAMNLLVNDKNLYQNCKQNVKASVAPFDIEIIGKQWLDLIVS